MRVRIRRFRSDSGFWPVVKFDPQCAHVGNSLFFQPAVVERLLHDAVGTHPPIAFAAARGHFDFIGVCPQRDQMAAACAGLLPLLPVVKTHSAPDPIPEFQHRFIAVADPEVVEPAGDVEPQRFSTIVREGDFSRNVSTSSKCRRLIWPRRLGSMGMCPST